MISFICWSATATNQQKPKKAGRPEKYSDSTLDFIEWEMGRENITLREVCKKHGFVYITIYNLMSTRKGGH